MKAAYYVRGRIVVGRCHMDVIDNLTEEDKNDGSLTWGFYNEPTGEFWSDIESDHFYDKQIYLIRHGVPSNPDLPDPDIADSGHEAIWSSASVLSDQNLRGFTGVVSPLLRCLKTAAIIQQLCGIEFEIVPEVMETPSFLKEGEVFKLRNRSQMFPQFKWPTSKEWHVFPETPHDFCDRAKESLQQLPQKCIVVAHHGIISLMAKLALSSDKAKHIMDLGIPPASVTFINRQEVQRLGWANAEVLHNRSTSLH